jgi:ParB/RepB/Spo0J family partition protein
MPSQIQSISIKNLLPHPDNPNRMSKENFKKLTRHIERTGRYEPLIVRKHLKNYGRFQIINGHHRFEALKHLGYETCDCVVWDIDDDETLLLLATLNRLCGQDVLDKKTILLEKINRKLRVDELSKLLPNTKTQIQRLIELQKNKVQIQIAEQDKNSIAYPMVFFLKAEQKATVEKAIEQASSIKHQEPSKAKRNAQAITQIAKCFIEYQTSSFEIRDSEVTDGKENQVCTAGTR